MTAPLSFITVTGSSDTARFGTTLASLRAQSRSDWELVVSGTLPPSESPGDRRVVVVRGPAPTPLDAANQALARATGEHVAFVDPGDELAPTTVAAIAAVAPGADCVYSDEDEIDDAGARSNPFLKPGWSPDRLRCQPYTGRVCALRRAVVDAVGGLRPEVEGAHEHDLVLRVTERGGAVVHLPEILYHRRWPPGGVAGHHTDLAAGRRVIDEHLARVRFPGVLAEGEGEHPGLHRLRPRLPSEPLVSVVIPTAGRSRLVRGTQLTLVANCVESLVKRSTYGNYEIVCVIGDEAGEATRARLHDLAGDRLRLVRYDGPFNFARAINLGALHARGDHLLMLNDDTQVITRDWIESMLMFAVDPGVGAVGAKLLFGDNRIQHAGIIAVGRGGPGHACYGFPGDDPGYADNFLVPSDYLAVTGACLLTKRACFEAVGGFATTFPLNYNDIDYCLKLRHRGLRVVLSPEATLFHFEWSSRLSGEVAGEELERLNERWGSVLERDPFYNRGFLPSTDFRPPVRTVAGARRAEASPSLRAPAAALP